MKKLGFFTIILLSLMLLPNKASAATCDYKEQNRLNAIASNMRSDYTVEKVQESFPSLVPGETGILEKNQFVANIYNMTNETYVMISNTINGEEKRYNYSDTKDGVLSINSPNNDLNVEFTIKVYTDSATCKDLLSRTITIKLPRNNPFYNYSVCDEAEGFYMCSEFLMTDYNLTDSEFFRRINEYIDNKKVEKEEAEKEAKSFFGQIKDFIVEYRYFIAGGIVLIGGGTAIVIIVVKRRRRIV